MEKRAILVVSFGTTHDASRHAAIEAVEAQVAAAFPEHAHRRAFTSPTVRKILERRGIHVDDVATALDRLAREGFREAAVLPTHLLPGEEYQRLSDQVAAFAGRFRRLTLARPLMDTQEDLRALAAAVIHGHPTASGQALLLMGHGARPCAALYEAMARELAAASGAGAFLAVADGVPAPETAIDAIVKAGYPAVRLAPLMLVAGEHAASDMAGDGPNSWKNRCRAAGLEVTCALRGLGELPQVRELYLAHLRQSMEE